MLSQVALSPRASIRCTPAWSVQRQPAHEQVHAAGHSRTHDPVQLGPLGAGQVVHAGRVGEQHDDPPRFRAAAGGCGGQLGEGGVLAGEHALVDPPDLFDEVVEQPAEPAGADEGEQVGAAQRGEPGQGAAEVFRVEDGDPYLAGAGGAERAQQQAGDDPVHRGLLAGQVQVGVVEQRYEGGQCGAAAGRRLTGGGWLVVRDHADPQQAGAAAALRLGRAPGRPGCPGGTGRADRGERLDVAGQRRRLAVEAAQDVQARVVAGVGQLGHARRVRVPDQASPALGLVAGRLGGGQHGPGGATRGGELLTDDGGERGAGTNHGRGRPAGGRGRARRRRFPF